MNKGYPITLDYDISHANAASSSSVVLPDFGWRTSRRLSEEAASLDVEGLQAMMKEEINNMKDETIKLKEEILQENRKLKADL